MPFPDIKDLIAPQEDKPKEFKVTPEILQIIYLDEITGRLAEAIEKLLDKPQGRVESQTVHVTHEGVKVMPQTGKAWCQITIRNDGDDPVYISSDVFGKPEAPLYRGEVFSYDAGGHVIHMLYLYTEKDKEATVRIWGMI